MSGRRRAQPGDITSATPDVTKSSQISLWKFVVLGWPYTNTRDPVTDQVTLALDGNAICLSAANAALRKSDGDR